MDHSCTIPAATIWACPSMGPCVSEGTLEPDTSLTSAFGILQHCCYNHSSLPSTQPFFSPNWCWALSNTTPHTSCIFSQPFAIRQLSSSAFREQSKTARLHLWAGWLFLNKALRNTLHPDPQASQGLCKHLSFAALCATASHRQVSVVPSSLWVDARKVSYKAE